MSSSFSDKPYPPPRGPEPPPPVYADELLPPRYQREPGTRLNFRRLLAGMSLLFILLGALLLCFIHGGLLNPQGFLGGPRWIQLDRPGHVAGFICLGIGAVGFVFLFSLEKRK
jgi:hypothetical protein